MSPTTQPLPEYELFIVRHEDYEAFAEARTDAAYEAIDNAFERFHLPIDIVAGMFTDHKDRRIYADQNVIVPALQDERTPAGKVGKELTRHEKGHEKKVPKHDHPTSPVPMFFHGVSVGFDYRAGTRVLRWRKGTDPPGYQAWWDQQKLLWRQGKLRVMPAPVAQPTPN